jgi:cold shock CspA family protein
MAETWNKKEREKKKQKEKKDKEEKRLERKEKARNGNNLDDMMAYLDENGNLVSTPPNPMKKIQVNAEDIVIGVPKQEDIDPKSYIHDGVVTHFNEAKGYGFIKDNQTQESLFVHANELTEQIQQGDKVSFTPGRGPKGPVAMEVRRLQ